jgi:hypothetical protein
MGLGIIQVLPTTEAWARLPRQPCDTVWFESADYDLSLSEGPPADIHFHVSRDDGPFRLELGALGNLDSFWIRSDGAVVLIWKN